MTASEQEFYAEVGRRIRRLRRRRGTTQQVLAHVVGMSRSDLCKVEQGQIAVRAWRLYLICRALNCDIHDVLPDANVRTVNPLRPLGLT